MVEDFLRNKYENCLSGLDIYENNKSIKLSIIIIKEECRNQGVGSKILNDIIEYADKNKLIITLTPSSDFGGNKNRLVQFYKRFGFKPNKGVYKSYEFMDSMIRYPKLNETIKKLLRKSLINELKVSKNKNLLKESLMTKSDEDIRKISDFVNFCKKYLGINDDVKIELAFERTSDLTTTAYYDLNGLIKVYVKDRAIIDIMRSIAHELTHHKQNLEDRIKNVQEDGDDGSTIENEANSKAGEMIRKYGRMNPGLYH